MKDVVITSEPIQLYKILKFEGLASNGGEAKAAVADGKVMVNGQVETRKRKQIVANDIIEFQGEKLRIRLIDTTTDSAAGET
jgi:ribosome-associated protein